MGFGFQIVIGMSEVPGVGGVADTTPGGVADAFLTEDDFGFTLEDGSGVLLLES